VNETGLERRNGRIVVALDASPDSIAALRVAAEIAALLDIELEGLFVEDINLIHLCGFPFGQEVGSYTATVRRLDNASIERQFRTIEGVIQKSMSQVATRLPVRWTFQVRRGPIVSELLTAAQDAALISLGRSGQVRRRTLGSTARALVQQSQRPLLLLGQGGSLVFPLLSIYTGSNASQRALQWLASLARYDSRPVRVIVVARPDSPQTVEQLESDAQQILGEHPVEFVPVRYGDVLMTLRSHNGGTLVISSDQTELLAEHPGPTVIVP
jgi:nucleotide-binding universal stress UspA family protein